MPFASEENYTRLPQMPTTIDEFLDGSVTLEQPAPGHGYRVNVDSILLARFAANVATEAPCVVDLGAGVGAVTIVLHALHPVASAWLVERDRKAAEISQRNVARAGLGERVQVVVANVEPWARGFHAPRGVLVVANPPYTPPGAGRRGGNAARDSARHGELGPFIRAVRLLLTEKGGRACICYPAAPLLDLLDQLQPDLHVKRMQLVQTTPAHPARLVLFEVVHHPATTTFPAPVWVPNHIDLR